MNLDEKKDLRIAEDQLLKIKEAVIKNKKKYSSSSHFVRCAIVRLLNEEQEKQ